MLSDLFDVMHGAYSQTTDRQTTIQEKSQDSAQKWIASSVQVLDGGRGILGGKPWPFNYRAAMVQCQSWVYAAAMGNARAAASVPLRMFVRAKRLKSGKVIHPEYKRASGEPKKAMWKTVPVRGDYRRYLKGRLPHKPSNHALGKMMAFGDDFEEVTDHPLIRLFRRVSPHMNGFQYTVLKHLCKELTGNFYTHPIMGSILGRIQPVELYPMLPHWVEVQVAGVDDDELIHGYVYGSNGANRTEFTVDEVIHHRYPNPRDLIYGLGSVEAAWSVLHLHHANRQSNISFFENNARPDFLVIGKPGTTNEQMDRFDSKLNKMMRGARKAARFLTLTGDVQVQPMQFPPKDNGTRDEDLEELAAIFGYPITKLKGNDPNRATAEQGDITHTKDKIHPMLVGDEEETNQWLTEVDDLARDGDMVFIYDDPVPKNREFELKEAQTAIAGGWRTIDEQRVNDGNEPYGGNAAKLLVNASVIPIDKLGQVPLGLGLNFGPSSPSSPSGITLVPRPGTEPADSEEPEDAESRSTENTGKDINDRVLATKEILEQVSMKKMAPKVGKQLIRSLGVDAEIAQDMIDAAVAFTPTVIDTDESLNPNSGDGSGKGRKRYKVEETFAVPARVTAIVLQARKDKVA